MPLNRRAYEIGAAAIALALLATMALLLARADGLLLADGQPMFGDFIAFWSAARAALDGHVAQIHEIATVRAYQESAVPGFAYVAPWNSPPTFLLIVTPFGTLPYPAAALTFLAISVALYLYAARKLLPDTRALIFAVTLPAAIYQLGTIQAALLIASVNALALVWLDKRPLTAGALVGLLAIKPHLALLWPLMLAVSGRWRAFTAAAVSTMTFVALAGLVFGFDAYVRFFENLRAAEHLVSGQRITTPAYASLYGNLLSLGAPQTVALAAQALSALAALFVASLIFRRGERALSGAALCAATLLVSPYLFFYDFTLLGAGAALLGAPRDRFEHAAFVFAWGAGLSLALGYLAPLPLCPLAAWLTLIAAFRRAGSAAFRPAPALQP